MCSWIWHYLKGNVRGTALIVVGVVAFTYLILIATRWCEARVNGILIPHELEMPRLRQPSMEA